MAVTLYRNWADREQLKFTDDDGHLVSQRRRLDGHGSPVRDSFTLVTRKGDLFRAFTYDLAANGRLPCPRSDYFPAEPEQWFVMSERCDPDRITYYVGHGPQNLLTGAPAGVVFRRFQEYGLLLANQYLREVYTPLPGEPPFELNYDYVVSDINPEDGRVTVSRHQRYSRMFADYPHNDFESLHVTDQGNDGIPDYVRGSRRQTSDPVRYLKVEGRETGTRRALLDRFRPLFFFEPSESLFTSLRGAKYVYVESGEEVRKGDPLFDIEVQRTRRLKTIRADRAGIVYVSPPSEYDPNGDVNIRIVAFGR